MVHTSHIYRAGGKRGRGDDGSSGLESPPELSGSDIQSVKISIITSAIDDPVFRGGGRPDFPSGLEAPYFPSGQGFQRVDITIVTAEENRVTGQKWR